MPFGGVIEHTNYIPTEEYGGSHVIYVSDDVLRTIRSGRDPTTTCGPSYLPAATRIAPALEESGS